MDLVHSTNTLELENALKPDVNLSVKGINQFQILYEIKLTEITIPKAVLETKKTEGILFN